MLGYEEIGLFDMQRCRYCGRENEDDAALCSGRGTELFEVTPTWPACLYNRKFWKSVIVAGLISPIAFFLAWFSLGIPSCGAGLLVIPKLLFPYTILCLRILQITNADAVSVFISVLPVLQVLIYGVLRGIASVENKVGRVSLRIVKAHVIAILLAFVVSSK